MPSSSLARLDSQQIVHVLEPFYPQIPDSLVMQLSVYLDLLLKWNARTNLTAIREPEEIVRRHFGESLFVGRHVPSAARTALDLGSGAGFPGLPVQIMHPAVQLTLAESQSKKAAFLREAVRTLGLATRVHADRAEKLITSGGFDVVMMRAVDDPEAANALARRLLAPGGTILHLTTRNENEEEQGEGGCVHDLPESDRRILRVWSS